MEILKLKLGYKERIQIHEEMINCLVEHFGKDHRLSISYLEELKDVQRRRMLPSSLLWSCHCLYKGVDFDSILVVKLDEVILKYSK